MDRETEVRHLAQADEHIADAEARVRHMEELVARGSGDGDDHSEHLLATMKQTLAGFREHRLVILQTIADIDAGKL